MLKGEFAGGWRELSICVGERMGRPVSCAKVRWAVESSGLRIGRKIGSTVVFDTDDMDCVARLLGSDTAGLTT